MPSTYPPPPPPIRTIKSHHDMGGSNICTSITLKWDCANGDVQLSMDGYFHSAIEK